MALTTKSPYERSLIGIARGGFGYISGMVIAIAFIPVVNAMGGDKAAWTKLASIFAILAGIGIFIAFISTKEKYQIANTATDTGEEDKVTFKQGIKLLFANKYWIMILGVNIAINIIYSISGATGVYYAKYIWGNENLVGIMGAVGLIPVFVGFVGIAPFIKKFGNRNTALGGIIIGIIGCAIRLIDPASFMIGLVGSLLQNLGTIPMMVVGGALSTATIEYGEWKTGVRIVGLNQSAGSFGSKVGGGLGTASIGWLLALGGYVQNAPTQSPLAKQMIIALGIYIPMLALVALAILLMKYKLDKEYPRIITDLEKRKINK